MYHCQSVKSSVTKPERAGCPTSNHVPSAAPVVLTTGNQRALQYTDLNVPFAELLNGAIIEAFNWDDKILIEKAVNAREIECSVTGNPTTDDGRCAAEKLTDYGPGEIVPKHVFYDYDAKYNDPDGADLLIPANLPDARLEEIRTLAKKAFAALDLCGLSRVDFFIDRDTDALYLNEINTLPGFTSISMFPKMCEKFGLGFTALTTLLIDEAIARFNTTRNLKTSR